MLRDPTYLVDILVEAKLILEFTQGIDQETFNLDKLRQHGVERSITIIGEAVRRLSDEFKNAHPEIAWQQIIGMRNILIHDYNNVKLKVMWEVVLTDIPALIKQIEPFIVPDMDQPDQSEG